MRGEGGLAPAQREGTTEKGLFRVALLVKGLDGAVELIAALALALGPLEDALVLAAAAR